jgi:hypothetical protein
LSEAGGLLTPELAIEDWLRRMAEVSAISTKGEVPDVHLPTRPPFPPVLSSTEVVKRREIPGRQVHALAYEDTAGSPWFWIVRLVQVENGSWLVCGGGGGRGDAQGDPERSYPWINYAGCWGKDGLALGGWVVGTGAERAASARLSMRDAVLVDDVDWGVVLFVT